MGIIKKKVWLIGRKGRCRVDALYDSGSTHSIVREDVAEQIATLDDLPEPKTYEAAVGSFTVRHGIFADILIRGKRLTAGLRVVRGLTEDLILGADFMQVWHIRLDPRRRQVILDPQALRLKAVGSRPCMR